MLSTLKILKEGGEIEHADGESAPNYHKLTCELHQITYKFQMALNSRKKR